MSSKSRSEQPAAPKPGGSHHAHGHAHGAGAGAAAAGRAADGGLLGDDVIRVPRGRNRLQYAFLVGLLIFLLITFLVPGAIMSTAGLTGNRNPDVVEFEDARGEHVVLTASEFQQLRNGFADVLRLPIQQIQFLRYFLGITGREPTNEEAARLIVLSGLAREAGVIVTDADLGAFLAETGADAEVWRQITQRYGGPKVVEEHLRELLAIRRYLDLMSQVARVPDVDAIERLWSEEHVEVAYDFVEIETSALIDEAKASPPSDEELEAWLAKRPEVERNAFKEPERYRVSFAVYRDPETTSAAGLLERYPEPADANPEERAQQYYNRVFFSHFRRSPEEMAKAAEEKAKKEAEEGAEGEGEGESESPEDVPPAPPDPYYSFEEVKERCLAEAPVYFALESWRADLVKRAEAGETIDLAAEALELGLQSAATDPLTLAGLREFEGLGGTYLASMATRTEPGKLAAEILAEADALGVVRVDEKIESDLPPFAEIRDRVVESWAKERAGELALERLAAVRDGFEELKPAEGEDDEAEAAEDDLAADEEGAEAEEAKVRRHADEATFRAAVEAAGLSVGRRDWLDKNGPPADDPDRDVFAHAFLAAQRAYADLEEGEVAEPQLDRTRTRAYLVRLAGKREMDLTRMSPQVYEGYKTRSAQEGSIAVRTYLTGPGLDERHGIHFLEPQMRSADEDADAIDEEGLEGDAEG